MTTTYQIRFVEHGKAFIESRYKGELIAGDFQVLAFSDVDIKNQSLSYKNNVLRYPDQSQFSSKLGSVSFALLRHKDINKDLKEYVFVQLQRRRELELAPSVTNTQNRFYNQVRFSILPVWLLDELYSRRQYILSELASNIKISNQKTDNGESAIFERDELLSPFQMQNYSKDDVGKEGILAGELLISPTSLPTLINVNLDSLIYQIANDILKQWEFNKDLSSNLTYAMPPDASEIIDKLTVVQRVQTIVFPRVGVITFAFDIITGQSVDILLLDSIFADLNPKTPKVSFTKNSYDPASIIIEAENDFYDPNILPLVRNFNFSLIEIRQIVELKRSGHKIGNISEFSKLLSKLIDSNHMDVFSQLISYLKDEEITNLFQIDNLSSLVKEKILEAIAGGKNLTEYWRLFSATQIKKIISENFLKHLFDIIRRSEKQEFLALAKDYSNGFLLFMMRDDIRAKVEQEKIALLTGESISVIKLLFELDDEVIRAIIKQKLLSEKDAGFYGELIAEFSSRCNLECLLWIINLTQRPIDSLIVIKTLRNCIERDLVLNAEYKRDFFVLFDKTFQEDGGFLSRIPSTTDGLLLREKMREWANRDIDVAEKVFFQDIVSLPYADFEREYLSLKRNLSGISMDAASECFKLLFSKDKQQSIVEALGELCGFNRLTCEKVLRVFINNPHLLSVEDLEYIFNMVSQNEYAEYTGLIFKGNNYDQEIKEINAKYLIDLLLSSPVGRNQTLLIMILNKLGTLRSDDTDLWLSLFQKMETGASPITLYKVMKSINFDIISILSQHEIGEKFIMYYRVMSDNTFLLEIPNISFAILDVILGNEHDVNILNSVEQIDALVRICRSDRLGKLREPCEKHLRVLKDSDYTRMQPDLASRLSKETRDYIRSLSTYNNMGGLNDMRANSNKIEYAASSQKSSISDLFETDEHTRKESDTKIRAETVMIISAVILLSIAILIFVAALIM